MATTTKTPAQIAAANKLAASKAAIVAKQAAAVAAAAAAKAANLAKQQAAKQAALWKQIYAFEARLKTELGSAGAKIATAKFQAQIMLEQTNFAKTLKTEGGLWTPIPFSGLSSFLGIAPVTTPSGTTTTTASGVTTGTVSTTALTPAQAAAVKANANRVATLNTQINNFITTLTKNVLNAGQTILQASIQSKFIIQQNDFALTIKKAGGLYTPIPLDQLSPILLAAENAQAGVAGTTANGSTNTTAVVPTGTDTTTTDTTTTTGTTATDSGTVASTTTGTSAVTGTAPVTTTNYTYYYVAGIVVVGLLVWHFRKSL